MTQFVDGGSSSTRSSSRPPGNSCAIVEVLRIGNEVCQALAFHAHERGIVHRDVKPGNIWLTRQGAIDSATSDLRRISSCRGITSRGQLLGTFAYHGAGAGAGARTSDLARISYRSASLLYELVAGRRPFIGDTLAARHHAAPGRASGRSSMRQLSAVPPALDALILRVLEENWPQDRPATAKEVADALAAIAADPTGRLGVPARQERAAAGASRLEACSASAAVRRSTSFARASHAALAGGGARRADRWRAGSGKTSLVEQLLTYAQPRGMISCALTLP